MDRKGRWREQGNTGAGSERVRERARTMAENVLLAAEQGVLTHVANENPNRSLIHPSLLDLLRVQARSGGSICVICWLPVGIKQCILIELVWHRASWLKFIGAREPVSKP